MNNLVFPNQPVSYNHTLASSLTINLNHYLGIERITQFLNNQLLELRFNLKQKCNLIFNILLEGENLTNALKQIKQVQISHNLGLIG